MGGGRLRRALPGGKGTGPVSQVQKDWSSQARAWAHLRYRAVDVELSTTPRGELRIITGAEPIDAALAGAFEQGTGNGLLHLGTALLGAELSASLAFGRALAQAYFTRLGAVADDDTTAPLPACAPEAAVLEALAAAVPPMSGGEYVTSAVLAAAWAALHAAMSVRLAGEGGTLQAWFERHAPPYNTLGKIVFHLAEHKADPARPFAFMASWATGIGSGARVQHVPLQRAVESAQDDRRTLLRMLRPLATAAQRSPWTRTLVDSRAVYQPRAWAADEAFALLREVPSLRAAGISVRMPPGWAHGRPPRVRVGARVGSRAGRSAGGALGFDALLDFDVALALDGEPLAPDEAKALLAGAAGLRLFRGRWVEVDPERLGETLARYESVRSLAAEDGLSFAEALRLLATAPGDDDVGDGGTEPWALASPGPWLADVLERLRTPEGRADSDPGAALHAELRPYQRAGVGWLWTLWTIGAGGCLADDMGLGKTVQVIALMVLVARQPGEGARQHLVVAPASVLDNWAAELRRFAPSLRVAIVHRSGGTEVPVDDADVVLTTYATAMRQPELAARRWAVVVLDEAQAIKNPGAKQTRAVKQLRARMRLALTGTPVENRLADLWSVFDFAAPGLLGDAKAFAKLTKSMAETSYAPLRELCRPWILRRLKSDRRVISDLPDKTEIDVSCGLSKAQATLYRDAVESLAAELRTADGVRRRGIVLAYLVRLKQICNHPSHWLGDGAWAEADSGKLVRLRAIAEEIAARQEKVLVFTQFREACDPLAAHLAGVFGREGLVLHGDVAVRKRGALVQAFAADDGPPFFVLSLRAGGTGLNLTAASHVIHFDRWWNPAVENQATDRAYRIGQRRNVLVHRFTCRGTVEERIATMLTDKRALADDILQGGSEIPLTEMPTDALLKLVRLDVGRIGAME